MSSNSTAAMAAFCVLVLMVLAAGDTGVVDTFCQDLYEGPNCSHGTGPTDAYNLQTTECECGRGQCPTLPSGADGYDSVTFTPALSCQPGTKLAYFEFDILTSNNGFDNEYGSGEHTLHCGEWCVYADGTTEGRANDDPYSDQDVTSDPSRVIPSDASTEDPPPASTDSNSAPPTTSTSSSVSSASAPSGVQGGTGSGPPPSGSASATSGMGSGYRILVAGVLALAYGAV